jgi:hypothetical protein
MKGLPWVPTCGRERPHHTVRWRYIRLFVQISEKLRSHLQHGSLKISARCLRQARKIKICRTFWIATIYAGAHNEQQRPHVMPIWGVWVDDAFCFSTGRKSRKGQNLAANAACTITNDDGKEAVIIEGMAAEVEDAPALERIATAYKKKYKMDPRGMKEPIFEVRPRTVFGFIEKSFPKSATRWKLSRSSKIR